MNGKSVLELYRIYQWDMKIDQHLLRISSGAIYIEKPLELGSDVTLIVRGCVVKLEDKDNQDGTCDRVFTVKGELAMEVKEV